MGKKDLNNGEQLYSNAPLQNADLSAEQKAQPGSSTDNSKKNKKGDKKKSNKPGFFSRIGKFFKEMFSELKKVTWPDAKKVFSQLGIVLLVVLIFVVIITAFDLGAAQLLKLLVGGTSGAAA